MNFFKRLLLYSLIGSSIFLNGCSKDPGTPPELLIDGTSIVVGESTPGSLRDSGFTTNNTDYLISELPDKSWTSSIYLRKDDVSYASLCLVNDSKEEKMISQCVIEEVGFYALDDKNKDLDIFINGINPIGKTQEELKELYPELELDDDDGNFQYHYLRDGEYSICFQYNKGVMTDIDVRHSFSKSYKEK